MYRVFKCLLLAKICSLMYNDEVA